MSKRADPYASDLEVIPDSEDERLRCGNQLQLFLIPFSQTCRQEANEKRSEPSGFTEVIEISSDEEERFLFISTLGQFDYNVLTISSASAPLS